MTEAERALILEQIGRRQKEPGIVLEWYQTEMERLYELKKDPVYVQQMAELKRDRAAAAIRAQMQKRQEEYEAAHPIVTVFEPPPADPISESLRQAAAQAREWRRLERRVFMKYIREHIEAGELREYREYLKNTRRRFPKTRPALWSSIAKFRRATVKCRILHQPNSFWEMEMAEHCRIAYIPRRFHDRPFSKMLECSIFTGTTYLPPYETKSHRRGRPPGPRKVKIPATENRHP